MAENKDSEENDKGIGVGKVLDVVSSIEAAIRYLLTGISLWIIAAGGLERPDCLFDWVQDHQTVAGALIVASGFAAFSFYRLIFWVGGDLVSWWTGQSAPSLFGKRYGFYDQPYTKFLEWRHSKKVTASLGGYLTYRWSVAHYSVITAVTLWIWCVVAAQPSLINTHPCVAFWIATGMFIIGVWQQWFLFRVERDLCRRSGHPEI